MRLSILHLLCLYISLLWPVQAFSIGFQTYLQEVSFLKLMLDCPREKTLPAMKEFGSLYICTLGDARTVKLYVSEKPYSDQVLNIGMMWHDWKINKGYGIHTDSKEAERALNFLIDMYVPARKEEIIKAFWDSKNEDFSTSEFTIYLTHKAGLQKDERLIVIEEK